MQRGGLRGGSRQRGSWAQACVGRLLERHPDTFEVDTELNISLVWVRVRVFGVRGRVGIGHS